MRRLTVIAALVAGVSLFAAVPALARSAATSDPTTFTDPKGDAGTAPDITTVNVSNDDAGLYTFDIALATQYEIELFGLYLDTDMNTATGNPDELGADYLVYDDHQAHSVGLYKWNGSDWEDADAEDTLSFTIATEGTGITISVNRSEIGNAAAFNFIAYSLVDDGVNEQSDDAPSGSGSWRYKAKPTVSLSLGAAKSVQPKAGGQWVTAVTAMRSDTGKTVGGEGTLTCAGSSGSVKLVTTMHAFVSGGAGNGSAALCSFAVPKSLKKKTVHATVTVTYNGVTLTHTFTAHVK